MEDGEYTYFYFWNCSRITLFFFSQGDTTVLRRATGLAHVDSIDVSAVDSDAPKYWDYTSLRNTEVSHNRENQSCCRSAKHTEGDSGQADLSVQPSGIWHVLATDRELSNDRTLSVCRLPSYHCQTSLCRINRAPCMTDRSVARCGYIECVLECTVLLYCAVSRNVISGVFLKASLLVCALFLL